MLQEDDEGSYSCVAENVLGQTVITAYLDVNHSQVKIFELNKKYVVYKNISPFCSKKGYPTISHNFETKLISRTYRLKWYPIMKMWCVTLKNTKVFTSYNMPS